MTAVTDGEYCMEEKLVKHVCQKTPKVKQDSPDHLHSLRRAPPPAPGFAQTVQSEKPGGSAAFSGSSAGLIGIVACSEHSGMMLLHCYSAFHPYDATASDECVKI